MSETCETCRFARTMRVQECDAFSWTGTDGPTHTTPATKTPIYACVRYAPRASLSYQAGESIHWPQVKASDWCGEHAVPTSAP